MKTIIKKIVLVALVLGTLSSYGTETISESIKRTEINVELKNVKKGQLWYIKNSEGKILYQEEIKSKGTYKKDFNFNSLENGYYTLEVNKDFQIEITPFTVVSGKANFYKKAGNTIFKPIVRIDDDKVMISKLDFENSPLQVTIFFEGDIIFKDVVKGENVLKRIYQLRKDIEGNYKVVVKANDRTYTNEFSL